jgi:hypothetical protein
MAGAAGRAAAVARLGRGVPAAAGLAALGLPLGVVLGFALILGIGLASPRQIFERLPGLAVAGLVLALPLAFTASRVGAGGDAGAGVALTGWWMAGAPMVAADAMRAAPVLLAVGLLAALLLGELGGPWRAVAAAALLAAVLGVARPPGPILLLAPRWRRRARARCWPGGRWRRGRGCRWRWRWPA